MLNAERTKQSGFRGEEASIQQQMQNIFCKKMAKGGSHEKNFHALAESPRMGIAYLGCLQTQVEAERLP